MSVLQSLVAPIKAVLLVTFAATILVACGGSSDSGAPNTQNPGNVSPGGSNSSGADLKIYEGAMPPADDDVQNFRRYLWSRIATADKCGACHTQGGAASDYPFVRDDNINLAYNAAIGYVNLSNPAASELVTKVAGGHNCWEGTSAANINSCVADLTSYISAWASASAPSSFLAALQSYAPTGSTINAGRSFSQAAPASFSTLHGLLQTHCIGCHTPSAPLRQTPFLAADVDISYQAIQNKVDINQTINSTLYTRLADQSHNCWSGNCQDDADDILAAINVMVADFPEVSLPTDLEAVASRGLTIGQGFVLSQGNRVEDSAFGLWRFNEGSGSVAGNSGLDASGSPLELDLRLSGDVEWWGSGGVRINSGKLQADTEPSRAIFDNIKITGEYSIEAWVVPLNVSQGENDPANIVSYSRSTERRNFMLAQQLYNYDFYNRNTLTGVATDENGGPPLSTVDAGDLAQATLQHVVATFSATEGRKIYVNGKEVAVTDPSLPGNFNEWEDDFVLVVGNEVSNNRQWQGSVRLLALHNEALSASDVKTNFDIGVGDKYYLMFPVGHLTGVAETYIVFQVEEFDQYSYVFSNPIFYVADQQASIDGITITGMRIGINSREVQSGQAYIPINKTIDTSNAEFIVDLDDSDNPLEGEGNGGMIQLSSIGTLVPKEFGTAQDQFFLTFDSIAGLTYSRAAVTYVVPEIVANNTVEQSHTGLKNFAEINATLSALTGISSADPALVNSDDEPLYEVVKQQLPNNANLQTFSSSHQMAIAQLAFKYCDLLVDTNPGFFGSLPAGFTTDAEKDAVIEPLLEALLSESSDAGAASTSDQPEFVSETRPELRALIDFMVADGIATNDVIKATCAATFGSAMMLIK